MILFIDTEFADVEASKLVSIALVSDCGRFEFYAERDPLPAGATHFVRTVVYPLLERGARAISDEVLTRDLRAFFARVHSNQKVLVAYDNQADLVLLNYALDGFESPETTQRPEFGVFDLGLLGVPFFDAVEHRFASDAELRARRHNAFTDAWVNRDAYVALRDRAAYEIAELQRLRQVDTELDRALEETFDTSSKAARWWSTPSRMFGGRHPSQEYAAGRRDRCARGASRDPVWNPAIEASSTIDGHCKAICESIVRSGRCGCRTGACRQRLAVVRIRVRWTFDPRISLSYAFM